jgi:hypothetical protein
MNEKASLEDKLNQARVFSLSAGQMLPYIESCKVRATEELLASYRSGRDLLAPTARLEAYTSIIEEIECKAVEFDHLVTKHQRENSK